MACSKPSLEDSIGCYLHPKSRQIKLKPNGDLAWARHFSGGGTERAKSIVVDQYGNSYITGAFNSTFDIDPGPDTFNLKVTSSFEIFIVKLDSNGDFVWAKHLESKFGASATCYALHLDQNGHLYATGYFWSLVDFDPGPDSFYLSSQRYNPFIAKYDTAGNLIWAKHIEGNNYSMSFAIDTDPFGNVYTTGYFYDTIDVDPGPGVERLISKGDYDIFVSKLDSNGDFVWGKIFGGTKTDESNAIKADASGNVYFTGHFSSSQLDFDPGPDTFALSPVGKEDIYLCKLNTDGELNGAIDSEVQAMMQAAR